MFAEFKCLLKMDWLRINLMVFRHFTASGFFGKVSQPIGKVSQQVGEVSQQA